MTGTAAEVTPVRSVDDHEIGVGPDHARVAEGVPRHRARQVATAGVTGSTASRWATSARRGVRAATRPDPALVARISTSAMRSSCSRCSAPGDSRSGRRSTASRSSSRRRSARRTRPPSPPAPPGLHLLSVIAGLGPGDEVITSPYSFVASANCFIYEGATPVFADVDARTMNLDPAAVEAAITERTKADRRGRHLRLPVRARPAARALREARPDADPGRLRGARRRVQGRAGRLARRRRGLRLLSEQADDDRRGRDGHDPLRGGRGVCS